MSEIKVDEKVFVQKVFASETGEEYLMYHIDSKEPILRMSIHEFETEKGEYYIQIRRYDAWFKLKDLQSELDKSFKLVADSIHEGWNVKFGKNKISPERDPQKAVLKQEFDFYIKGEEYVAFSKDTREAMFKFIMIGAEGGGAAFNIVPLKAALRRKDCDNLTAIAYQWFLGVVYTEVLVKLDKFRS
ncbi:MAG: hypothetical protein A2452_10515 [Candidatus Firestonebacteria bacterium RIFOXYC2_FULL_39_67]|nr:MAG: hypothetical protein A2452_10515 [Candidatus Firestonebacteria bacterium RIFOXYC2_FULL_39_67]